MSTEFNEQQVNKSRDSKCMYCGIEPTKAEEMTWTECTHYLFCKSCKAVLKGIAAYKKIFRVEYVLPMQHEDN